MRSGSKIADANKKSLLRSLLILEVASIAVGYTALAALTNHPDVRVLDASPSGLGRFMILVQGEQPVLREQLQKIRAQLDGGSNDLVVDHDLIEDFCPKALEAVFSLAQHELEESLVVAEADTVSGLLSLSQIMTHVHGLNPIDIKILRGAGGGGYGFFTGPTTKTAPAAEDARTHLKSAMRKGRIETIENPSDGFRRFFNLSGEV
jgi:hypothetical protein